MIERWIDLWLDWLDQFRHLFMPDKPRKPKDPKQ